MKISPVHRIVLAGPSQNAQPCKAPVKIYLYVHLLIYVCAKTNKVYIYGDKNIWKQFFSIKRLTNSWHTYLPLTPPLVMCIASNSCLQFATLKRGAIYLYLRVPLIWTRPLTPDQLMPPPPPRWLTPRWAVWWSSCHPAPPAPAARVGNKKTHQKPPKIHKKGFFCLFLFQFFMKKYQQTFLSEKLFN